MTAGERIDEPSESSDDWRDARLAEIRRMIREADPEITEESKWRGTPVWSRDGNVCLAKAFKDKVKVTFPEGASLPDDDGLFNNGLGGKKWRAIDIYRDDRINEESFKALIRSAIDHNRGKVKNAKKPGATEGDAKESPVR